MIVLGMPSATEWKNELATVPVMASAKVLGTVGSRNLKWFL